MLARKEQPPSNHDQQHLKQPSVPAKEGRKPAVDYRPNVTGKIEVRQKKNHRYRTQGDGKETLANPL